MEEAFLQKIKAVRQDAAQTFLKDFRERIMESPIRSVTSIFRSIDDFFSKHLSEFFIKEVSCDDIESMGMLGSFYTETYLAAFSDENERESLDNIIYYLKKKKSNWYGKNQYHVVLMANQNNQILGGAIFDYYASCNAGIVEFIVVSHKFRYNGYGTRLYEKIIELLHLDAKNAGHQKADWIFAEIEAPDTLSVNDRPVALFFWQKMKFSKLNFNYTQPALSKDKKPAEGLWLIANCLEGEASQMPVKTLKNFLLDYARYGMRIDKVSDNNELSKMIYNLEIAESAALDLVSLDSSAKQFLHKRKP
ncbi:MAG: GNAT family N-acetyltransferase [Christensenellales bacterium]